MLGELDWTDLSPHDRCVLVVNDEPALCSLLVRWLTQDGWKCWQASEATQALELLSRHPLHVVTSDLNLPGHDGIWLLEQINAAYPDTAVLMLTAAMDTQLAIEALTKGAAGYLLKPIQYKEYLFQVCKAWKHGQLIHERRKHLCTLERRVYEQTVTLKMAQEEIIHRLVMASACRNEETGAHIRRTGLLSELLARSAGWSAAEAEQLRMAAPMHDVGKIGIPDAILHKRAKLTDDEFQQMKQHTTIGACMLAGSQSPVLQLAEKIALSHHERWDGDGYPHRIAGEQIPEAARILSIVDVYDAISHDRIYRPAMSEEAVLEIMRHGMGTHFDPHLLALFLANYEQFRNISLDNPDEMKCKTSPCETLLSHSDAILWPADNLVEAAIEVV